MKSGRQNRKFLLGSILAGVTVVGSLPASATCTDQPYIGSVCMTAATFCPRGYVEANGGLLSIPGNEALYSLIGTNYGGNGQTTFGVPDMRGRTPVGIGTGPGLSTVAQGLKRGTETNRLTIENLPAHNHTAQFTPTGGSTMSVDIPVSGNTDGNKTAPDSDYSYLASSPETGRESATIWSNTLNKVASVKGVAVSGGSGGGSVTVGNTGGNVEFGKLPPQIGLRYCLATEGLFPPRP